MANRSKVDASHCHLIARPYRLQQALQFAAAGLCAARRLAIDLAASVAAQLRQLGVERLAVGADTGISENAILRVYFGHIFR